MDFLQAHQQNSWHTAMNGKDINTSEGCGGQSRYSKWLLWQIISQQRIL